MWQILLLSYFKQPSQTPALFMLLFDHLSIPYTWLTSANVANPTTFLFQTTSQTPALFMLLFDHLSIPRP
jgi:hypothetical protein